MRFSGCSKMTRRRCFDVIVVDFPDPTNFSIGKLYTNSFYALLDQRLSASGYAVVQTTSPLVARQSFWTVVQTIESVGLHATPYHAHVPSFGEWGFVIASRRGTLQAWLSWSGARPYLKRVLGGGALACQASFCCFLFRHESLLFCLLLVVTFVGALRQELLIIGQ
jgi:hypothetical protein